MIKKKTAFSFQVGDLVYVENGDKLNRHKLDEIWIGPYPITKKVSNAVYELDTGFKWNAKRFYHVSETIKLTSDYELLQHS